MSIKQESRRANDWLAFEKAREFARSLGIKSVSEWAKYCKSGKKPHNIPAGASRVYKNEGWNSWADFLGTRRRRKGWPTYQEAKKTIASLGLKNYNDWCKLMKEGKLPNNLPTDPAGVYKDKGWTDFPDFLGTTLTYLSFEQARDFVHSLRLKNENEWREYSKSGTKPRNIPASPSHVYKNTGWSGTGDWLGTGYRSNRYRRYLPFEQARMFVHSLKFKNVNEWNEFKKLGKLPNDIPFSPNGVYKNQGWIGWTNFLGISKEIQGLGTSKEKQKWLSFE